MILVVDDTPSIIHVIERILSIQGLCVLGATDGIEALDVLATHPEIECLITDVAMPRMNGVELMRQVRSRYPRLPIIVISGIVDREEIPGLGETPFLSKPFHPKQLSKMVRDSIYRR